MHKSPASISVRLAQVVLFAGFTLVLNGCGLGTTPAVTAAGKGVAFSGTVHGGQQVVGGSKIYLYAVSQTGYNTAATSLLGAPGYVTSDTVGGNWSITGDYTCPAGAYVYLLALGGNPGLAAGTNNPEIALMAGLGPCSSLTPTTRSAINEETTVSTVYALNAFLTSETNVGTSATNIQGMQNAFLSIPNLVNQISGLAPPTNSAGGLTPRAEINSLANALSACVNSDGTGAPCSQLMTAANVSGQNGTPIDTTQATINIAKNPGVNVGAIYNLSTANSAFLPTLSAAPNDWTMTLQFPGVNQSQGIAIDATGNAYATNLLGSSITEFSPQGAVLKTLSYFTVVRPQQPAIDMAGNIWVGGRANTNPNNNVTYAANLTEFSSNGTLLSGANGFTGGGLVTPRGLAFDPSGNIWAAGSSELSKFSGAGIAISPSTGYTGGGLQPISYKLAFDTLGNAWAGSFDPNAPTTGTAAVKFSNAGVALSPAGGFVAGSTSNAGGVAIDGSNNAWISNSTGNGFLTKYSNAGALLSPAGGYQDGGFATANATPLDVVIDGVGNVFSVQSVVTERTAAGVAISPANGYFINGSDCCLNGAVDLSGNLWVTGGSNVYLVVGAAAPVVTPIIKAVINGTIATRP